MSDRSLNNSTKKSALLAYSWWDILMTIIFSRKFLLIFSLCQKLILILVSTSKKSGKKLIQRNIAIVCVSSFHFEQKVTFQTRDFRLAPWCIKTNLAKKILLVVLTVRISFLHKCSRHWDFANLINSCQNVWIEIHFFIKPILGGTTVVRNSSICLEKRIVTSEGISKKSNWPVQTMGSLISVYNLFIFGVSKDCWCKWEKL